ncbi:MAG: UDP-glucose 4-epimerase GalE [Gammaproteobacteria bacterium]|nr:UDP-glucose 4-epimerase GalE [Gammaproteobacteria bacterium]
MSSNKILVTGGCGYIGSHTTLLLFEAGFDVVVVDNLANSSKESLRRVEQLSGKTVELYQLDVRDNDALTAVFAKHEFKAVIHFAGLKAVGESTEIPLDYYDQNISGTINLLKVMQQFNCYQIVFSSSATVYGDPASVPITEDFPTSATNPYGRTKLFVEEILRDLSRADDQWHVIMLRYFNPIGAHQSGLIGEQPQGIPNNLMPFISQVAAGKRDKLSIFGGDYSTPDGTGIRDYIHVMDLSDAHVKAIHKIDGLVGTTTLNIGTGNGYSVLEMVHTFEEVTGVFVAHEIVERRAGDIAECWAEPKLASSVLGWKAKLNLNDMMTDTWRWQKDNPDGF